MRISVNCDSCSHEFTAGSKLAGKRVKCPACGEPIRVPVEDTDERVMPRRSSGIRTKRHVDSSSRPAGLMLGLGIGAGGATVLALLFWITKGGGGNVLTPVSPTPEIAVSSPYISPPVPANPSVPVVTSSTESLTSTGDVGHSVPTTNPTNPLAESSPLLSTTVAANKPDSSAVVSTALSLDASTTNTTPGSDRPIELSMTDLVVKMEKSVVRITVKSEEGSSVGSGFVIDSDGSIMTNYHVIESAKSAVVEFDTGKKVDVTGFYVVDMERDLAIIKIDSDSSPLHKVRVAGDLPKKGEKVAAFGAPRGLSFTASDGIISAIRRCPDPDFKARKTGCYLQTTAPISPGNSGGPLVNMRGEVVGINSFKIQGENLNFAASATDLLEVIENRGDKLTPLSPDALPNKYTDRFARAENLAGTTRGNLILGRIQDSVIMMLPFAFDPTGRVSEYVELQVEKNLVKKAGWTKVNYQSQVKGSTAFVVVLIYFQMAENVEKADEKLISELMCRVRIVARDVDKDGDAYTAIVWDESKPLGTISIGALYNGILPDRMKSKISEFFNKITVAHRSARRAAETGK